MAMMNMESVTKCDPNENMVEETVLVLSYVKAKSMNCLYKNKVLSDSSEMNVEHLYANNNILKHMQLPKVLPKLPKSTYFW